MREQLDQAALESALSDLARALDIPATPDFAPVISARLREPGSTTTRTRFGLPWSRRPHRPMALLGMVLVAMLLLVAAVAVAIGLGLPGLRFMFGDPASAPATAPPASHTQLLPDLGSPITIDEARAGVAFTVYMPDPAVIGDIHPDVYLDSRVIGGEVVLAYPAHEPVSRPGQPLGLVVTQTRALVDEQLLGKLIGRGTTVQSVDVHGDKGFWVSGAPHSLLILDADGEPRTVTLRGVGDVLIWVHGTTLIRIESPLGLTETMRIAGSMR